MSRCHSTYNGVAAFERTKTAVTGQAASHTHPRGAADPPPGSAVPLRSLPSTAWTGAFRVSDMTVPSDFLQYDFSRT
ncbi:hypothetical protein GCM10010303_09660 [Streptomyces purpurascens]|nr:hypothetical protein GCM10010303_09660 [Streptomyces purpurascens]